MKLLRFLSALFILLMLAGCAGPVSTAEEYNPCRTEVMAMDTVMTLTVYHQPAEEGMEILQKAIARIEELESLLSVTKEDSEIYRVNRSDGAGVPLSGLTRELLEDTLALCKETGGALDVTVYPAVRAWGFTTGDYRVPEEAELSVLTDRIDYTRVSLEDSCLTLPDGMELDLGAVAKGYAGDRLMALFREEGISSAIVELGGNVQTLGRKPDGSLWRVALQAPEGGYAGVLEIAEKAVVTSGGYQRYFEQDGETYIHIIDPSSGRPVQNGLASVTIVADSGLQGDGLSTALFVMGREKAEAYWRAHPDFECILLCEDGTAVITEGLENSFSLCGDWTGQPLEVIRR